VLVARPFRRRRLALAPALARFVACCLRPSHPTSRIRCKDDGRGESADAVHRIQHADRIARRARCCGDIRRCLDHEAEACAMTRNDIGVRITALGAAASLAALVLGGVVAAFGSAPAQRALPDSLPPVAHHAPQAPPIPVAIVPGRIEVTGERSTETADSEPSTSAPRS
jgi:hypothetical protein